jgi:hypothetical protein
VKASTLASVCLLALSESESYLPSISSSATGSQNLTEKTTGTKPKSKKESGEKVKVKYQPNSRPVRRAALTQALKSAGANMD